MNRRNGQSVKPNAREFTVTSDTVLRDFVKDVSERSINPLDLLSILFEP